MQFISTYALGISKYHLNVEQNGFPVRIIQNHIGKFLDKKHQIIQNKEKQEK